MSDAVDASSDKSEIELEYELDATPDKVWRAITIPAFRDRWLPGADLAGPDPIGSVHGVEVRYRMRDDGEPPLESTVTFRIEPGDQGGTRFRIIHRTESRAFSANDNMPPLSLAA